MSGTFNGYAWNEITWNGGDEFDLDTASAETICISVEAVWEIEMDAEIVEC